MEKDAAVEVVAEEENEIGELPCKDDFLSERVPNQPPAVPPLPKGVIASPFAGGISVTDLWESTESQTLFKVLRVETKHRLQIDFSEKAYKELQNLQSRLDAPSKSEVIRQALGVLRWVVDEVGSGHQILVEKPDGIREIVFHFIPPSRARQSATG